MGRERLLVFSLAATVSYTLAYYFNWPLLIYYPVAGEVRVLGQTAATGFPIFWYGWLASAAVIGTVAACVVPRRLAQRLPFDLSWIIAIVMIVAAVTYEKRWF
jgi:hypothetical protein